MSSYKAPITDMQFILKHVVGLHQLEAARDLDDQMVATILAEAGKLAGDILAPLNHSADRAGSRLEGGKVVTPAGFKEAYRQYRESGWNGVPFNPDYGGQGLPLTMAFPVQEMWQASNMSFGLCPMLNQAAVEAIDIHGTQEQKNTYLAKLISGEWTGTMNLTEPQAGTDLSALQTKAIRQDDGSYKLSGQKIFITYGDHDLAENIIHMVLARTPDAPAGVKGISLFLVPKFIPDAQGNPGVANDLICTGLEHKMGIHGSPTCTMQYGDHGGAVAWLIGQEYDGLKCMFTMMNNARLAVGLQGVAVADRAYQHALHYARERVQGTRISEKNGARVAIIEHPDVRRMLLSMKAQVMAGRMLCYEAAFAFDRAHEGVAGAQDRVDLLTPVVKAWCTDMAIDVTSTGVQIHGGMGFIEETGAAQFYRDARITAIYEGTNGIQALDLSMRKVIANKGLAALAWLAEVRAGVQALNDQSVRNPLEAALRALDEATHWVLTQGQAGGVEAVAAVNVPYLRAFGLIAGGVMMGRWYAAAAQSTQPEEARLLAHYYIQHILPQYKGCIDTVLTGSSSVCQYQSAMFG
ncbi:MAG: acyl-CoA dehydrogenase [Alphaproteobacteria bacterium]|nr:acyl-CoA dehydrogenase [Alphaproteobacteria bacterium]